MFARFEVRVREAEEDLLKLVLVEEVGEEFHRVGADTGDVLVGCARGDGDVVCFVPRSVVGGCCSSRLGGGVVLFLFWDLAFELGLGLDS